MKSVKWKIKEIRKKKEKEQKKKKRDISHLFKNNNRKVTQVNEKVKYKVGVMILYHISHLFKKIKT